MSNDIFVNDLMQHIINGVKIPKVQVERAINPILSLFIESILNEFFKVDKNYPGLFKLVSPEFPLKKSNNQSTNIDYLLVNHSQKVIVFFELKTDVSSLDVDQMNRYLAYKNEIANSSSNILRENLEKIRRASSKSSKYDYVISRFNSGIPNPKEILKVIIIYLVPNAIKNQIIKKTGIDYVWDYNDLPMVIGHKYADYWTIVRDNLLELDYFFKKKIKITGSTNPLDVVVKNIKDYIGQLDSNIFPISIRLGTKGDGSSPNYQVKFSDDTIKTFHFTGKPHRVKIFKTSNLSEEYLWDNIKNEK